MVVQVYRTYIGISQVDTLDIYMKHIRGGYKLWLQMTKYGICISFQFPIEREKKAIIIAKFRNQAFHIDFGSFLVFQL